MNSDLIKLIDLDYYRETTRVDWGSPEEALEHQLTSGWQAGNDPNPWFSNAYYRSRYSDVAAANVSPLLHFVEHGHKEGRDPSERFSTSAYRNAEMQTAPSGNPLVHFLERRAALVPSDFFDSNAVTTPKASTASAGLPAVALSFPTYSSPSERLDGQFGRAVRPVPVPQEVHLYSLVDSEWYARTHGLADARAAFEHYLNIGRVNLLAPNRRFSALSYLHENYDVYNGGLDPALHYVLHGRGEGRSGLTASSAQERRRPLVSAEGIVLVIEAFNLDLEWYLGLYPELDAPHMNAVLHFRLYGEAEGRSPNRFFDARYYKLHHAKQLDGWKGTALEHFLAVGFLNGCKPSASVAAAMHSAACSCAAEWYLIYTGTPEHVLRRSTFDTKKLPEVKDFSELDPLRTSRTYLNQSGPYRRTINWVIPKFSKGAGGHTTIFRCARTLSRLGWNQVFWIYDEPNPTEALRLRTDYCAYFPSTPSDLRVISGQFYAIRNEFVVATAWQSCRHVNAVREGNVGLYFVQDFEPMFLPAGETALKAEWSYQLGLDCICAGDWLLGRAGKLAPQAMAFSLAAERRFKHASLPYSQRRYDLCLYLRGHTERRCSELLATMLVELAQIADLRVCVFGDDTLMERLPDAVEQLGIISPERMAEIFAQSRIGIAASATNYSIVPVEMAASGMLVIEPASSSTQETTRCHGVIAFPPDAKVLAHEIVQMLAGFDDAAFAEATQTSREWAIQLDWEAEFERVGHFLERYLKPTGAETPAMARPGRTVTVAIPTYYPGEQLIEVVAAIRSQLCSARRVDILIVDSVKDGKRDTVMARLEPGSDLRIHEIDAQHFQHGDTRNLAAALTDSEIVVFLTQDAIPVEAYWLESLITPFAVFPSLALSYGRHTAYTGHNRLYGIELDQMFDGIAARGALSRTDGGNTRFANDVYYRAGLCFNSDNNAAYNGEILRRMKFPSVPFAEDQAFAALVLEAGYSTFFASTAVVRHSHDYTADLASARARGFEEGQAFKQNFNTFRLKNRQQREQEKLYAAKWATEAGIKHGCSLIEIDNFIAAKHSYVDGIWDFCDEFVDDNED